MLGLQYGTMLPSLHKLNKSNNRGIRVTNQNRAKGKENIIGSMMTWVHRIHVLSLAKEDDVTWKPRETTRETEK